MHKSIPIEDLEVSVFEWPTRFFVEAENPDRDYAEFYPHIKEDTPPHFVDLLESQCGWCSCRDFRINLLVNENRATCKHIEACILFLQKHKTKPVKMPEFKL